MKSRLWLYALLLLPLLFVPSCSTKKAGSYRAIYQKKGREMRAAWWPTVWRNDFNGLSAYQIKQLITQRLDKLRALGINTIIFQVRSEGDAFYFSSVEPWSRFLSGQQGNAPDNGFDPLSFIIEAAHQRGMELHAWINPFRVAVNRDNHFAANHPIYRHPEWIVYYQRQAYLDPGIPAVRHYVCSIARDIVMRYSIDALHIDDYFYPYPVAGVVFEDDNSFRMYGLSRGFSVQDKGNWRRENINFFIEELKETILHTKPWIPLGVSPFGIYRNKKNFPKGSNTSGLEGYEALYADVLLWAQRGWIDYLTPQLYWNIGNPAADYHELVQWWSNQQLGQTALYIGQDIRRTIDGQQLSTKIALQRASAGGDFWWPADDLWKEYGTIGTQLPKIYSDSPIATPYNHQHRKTSSPKVKGLRCTFNGLEGARLEWDDMRQSDDPLTPRFYVVYGLPHGKKRDYPKRAKRLSISARPYFEIPSSPQFKGFAVTSLNHFSVESKPSFLFFE